ncbi:MAG TPA: carbamate kinase [Jiangellaceae bacterium]|nr:carbamate kinase [Jiangellaceae bacterium]
MLIALGGNAMTAADGRARPEDQIAAVRVAVEPVADLVTAGIEVVLTHGNGPQVGNLLVKNELAASVVPPVPLDWCGAQTQGTIGFILINALERALAARGGDAERPVTAIVTRTRVEAHDPGFDKPTKPIGRYLPAGEAKVLIEHGQTWEDRGEGGWRRVVASPEPQEILDAPAVAALIAAGFVVVAAGGGGVPVVREPDGSIRGVEAVIDKDLAAALLGRMVDADLLVIATDVPNAVLGFGTDDARPLGRVDVATMRRYAADGQFASGSMGPKVEAACRFVEQRDGRRAVITSLDRIAAAVGGATGTEIVPDR